MLVSLTSGCTLVATAALLLPGVAYAATVTPAGCAALAKAGLTVTYPSDALYAQREASYWAANAPQAPYCIVQPKDTAQVATALKTLSATPGNFAVRSGGHSHWAGGSDINKGVTVDLGLLNQTTYNPKTGLASIQPAPRWADVFQALEAQGVIVAGGRDGNVGVGGFLTGGGNSYYTGRAGMGCDSVVNFEVVLADGRIINANKNSNSDLWKALKGGSGNFGIVTRFDMQTLKHDGVWGGIRVAAREQGPALITALVNFTNNVKKYPQDALIINFTYNPASFPGIVVAHVLVDTFGVAAPPAFDQVRAVPVLADDTKVRSMSNMANSYLLPNNERNTWFTLTFKNDPAIVQKGAELHDQLVKDLLAVLPADAFSSQCLFQPFPTSVAAISVANGGNVLGLDSVKDNALQWLGTVAVKTAAHEAIVRPKLAAFSAALEAFAKSKGGDVPWRYLNYADPTQNPLRSYGAANFAFLKTVSAKYDPNAVFQKKSPAGFKLSKA